jgi:hypothetical protein
MVRQCNPSQLHYLRERGLKEYGGYFLADDPCRHLKSLDDGTGQTTCDIYDKRPVTCRDFCGKELSGGRRYFVPAGCTRWLGGGGWDEGDEWKKQVQYMEENKV